MRYSLLSFDLDGTLVETAPEIAEAANRTLADFGIERQDPALIQLGIGAGTREMMLRLIDRLTQLHPDWAPRMPVDAMLARLDVHYAATVGSTAQPYPGCLDMLDALRNEGLRLACLTNKEKRYARRVLKACGLYERFDLVVGGDSLPHKKPHPSTLEHVISVLGGERHRCAHIGDSGVDVLTGRNAGVEVWGVSWGYNGGVPIQEARPDRVFDRLSDIAEHVIRLNGARLVA